MASSMTKTNGDGESMESKQLLYSDVFGQSYQEDRLHIVGKSKTQDRLKTFSVPHSSVLSQLKSFLPQLSDANQKLASDIEKNPQRADEINIECVDEHSEGKHIEMNLSMVPTVSQDASDESDSESDESGDDNDIDIVEEEQHLCHSNDTSNGQLHDGQRPSRGRSDKRKEQNNLMKLKLPSSNKSGRKHKAAIEEIVSKPSTFQEESANG